MPAGRPSKLTRPLIKRFGELVRTGNYGHTAASACGIQRETFYAWLKQGAEDRAAGKKSLHQEFSDTFEKATAEADCRDIQVIAQASERFWQAAAWRQERKNPEDWGRKDRTEITGQGGGPVKMDVTDLNNAASTLVDRLAVLIAGTATGSDSGPTLDQGEGGTPVPVESLGETEPTPT